MIGRQSGGAQGPALKKKDKNLVSTRVQTMHTSLDGFSQSHQALDLPQVQRRLDLPEQVVVVVAPKRRIFHPRDRAEGVPQVDHEMERVVDSFLRRL